MRASNGLFPHSPTNGTIAWQPHCSPPPWRPSTQPDNLDSIPKACASCHLASTWNYCNTVHGPICIRQEFAVGTRRDVGSSAFGRRLEGAHKRLAAIVSSSPARRGRAIKFFARSIKTPSEPGWPPECQAFAILSEFGRLATRPDSTFWCHLQLVLPRKHVDFVKMPISQRIEGARQAASGSPSAQLGALA